MVTRDEMTDAYIISLFGVCLSVCLSVCAGHCGEVPVTS